MASDDAVLNARQAAEFLGAHVETLRRLARRGSIPSFKVGTDWRFSKEALERWFEGQIPQQKQSPKTILVVDDDAEVVQSISRIVERLGYSSMRAANGAEALELLSGTVPDLIFLDLDMPVMNGPALLAQLRPLHPELPVVIVTGYPNSNLMHRAAQHPPLMLLPKPADPEQVKRTIHTLFGARPATAATRAAG